MLCFPDSVTFMKETLKRNNSHKFPVLNKSDPFKINLRNAIQVLIRNLIQEIKYIMPDFSYS